MFSGVEVGVNYKWNYTCVHCNKLAENENSLDCGRIGQELKSTQYVYMNDAQRNVILLQAKQNIPELKTNFKTKWDNGDISLNGRCPHCNKEQHWDSGIKNSKTDTTGILIFSSIILAAIISIVIFIVAAIINSIANNSFSEALKYIFLVTFIISFIISFMSYNKDRKRLNSIKAELENKEESPPIFVGWTNEWHKFRNTNGMKDI